MVSAMIAGHIDALTARLKPVSTKPNSYGYIQLGVAQYAGGINETWWDRDLSVGGRVIVRDPETKDDREARKARLAEYMTPNPSARICLQPKLTKGQVARIPTLAPHFGIGMTGRQQGDGGGAHYRSR